MELLRLPIVMNKLLSKKLNDYHTTWPAYFENEQSRVVHRLTAPKDRYGYVWKFIFPSGTVSVARHSETYGSEDNLFEVALYKGNKMLSYGEIKKTFNLLFASTSITANKDEILTILETISHV